jgi:rSAM/selenodomain-associated transferase 1
MRRETPSTTESLTVGLMAKYWEIGKVKTRLGATLGMPRAARIHKIFVQHLCARLGDAGDARSFCLSPIQRSGDVAEMLDSLPNQSRWNIADQGDGDLGERMQRWFQAHLVDARSCAILIGADCPTIGPDLIERARRRLQDHDVVIGPAADGGYYLIGVGGAWNEIGSKLESLFRDVPWSTSEVLNITKTRAAEAGLSVAELETLEDVDTIAELNRLIDRLGSDRSNLRDFELNSAIEQTLKDPSLADSA